MTEQEKREKAIEEMARIARIGCVEEKKHDDGCLNHPYCVGTISAIRLYDAGYRKADEVRKGVPTSPDWDKKVALYFSKDKKSLARVPEEYRGEVSKLCGKVVGEFVCDKIITDFNFYHKSYELFDSCLSREELRAYFGNFAGFGLHISDLKIYDKPKELSEFNSVKVIRGYHKQGETKIERLMHADRVQVTKITRPPQSWQFVEEVKV